MKTITTYIRQNCITYLSMLFVFFYSACQDIDDAQISDVNARDITFSVKVPGSTTPKTYALSENDENQVNSIEILLFDTNGKYTYQPIYSNIINTDADNSRIKTFTVQIPEGTYNIIILANARQAVSNIISGLNEGDSKASVLEKLLISNSGKWNTNPASGGYISIPMFGEISSIVINGNTPFNTPVNLVRMISKIDVALTHTDATSKFKLESIRLYNYNNKGYIAPEETNWNQAQSIVTGASIPTSSNLTLGPLVYDGTAITTTDISSIGEIYTFEAIKTNPSTLTSGTCLVIGGTYTGDSQPTYYRVDFAQTSSSTTTYLPLLRNHHYKVNITRVSDSGFATPTEAFNSRPANIEANVIVWNDAKISDIVFDGQYMFGSSQKEFTFSRDQRNIYSLDNTISITTDYPPGWKVDKIVDASQNNISWLGIVSLLGVPITTGTSGSVSDMKLSLSENTSGLTRIGFIHLSAGRLIYVIKVTQNTDQNLDLNILNLSNISISELVFSSVADVPPSPLQFKIKWLPTTLNVTANRTDLSSIGFSFDLSYDRPGSGTLVTISDPLGEKTFTVRPTTITSAELAINPFLEKVSIVDFKLDNGVSTVSKSIFLRQIRYNILTEKDTYYVMDGTQKYFTVKTNTDFTVEIKNNPNSVIQSLVTTSGAANTNGTRVYFNIINDISNPTIYNRDVVFTIKSPQGRFADTDVTLSCYAGIIQPKSNSYIVNPGATPILIPVSRANDSDLGVQLGASEAFSASLVWTDNVNKIASNSNVSLVYVIGTGTSGYLIIKPGSAQGNAVVAVKNSSNNILWSWHIWVTNYTPTPLGTGKFMDRNLGALGNTVNTVDAKGLLYQWGRKDPFPGSTTVSGTTEPTLYTSTGTTAITKSQVSAANNLANAIANPSTFYQGVATNTDWYTNGTGKNDVLWNASAKTVYDPCPNGWRVPASGVWGSTAFAVGLNSTTLGTNGIVWDGYGGWYPIAGYRNDASGNITNVATSGFYWTATGSSFTAYASYMTITAATITPSGSTYRAGGYSVRCVSEQ
ncbi:MAG: fimbrial protein [Dysgonomonas sp.]